MKYLAQVNNINNLFTNLKDLQKGILCLDVYLKKYFPDNGYWEFEAEEEEVAEMRDLINSINFQIKFFYAPTINIFEAPQGVRRVEHEEKETQKESKEVQDNEWTKPTRPLFSGNIPA